MGVFNMGVLEICWRGTDTAELEGGEKLKRCSVHPITQASTKKEVDSQ